MMTNTSHEVEVTGPAVRADSYFGYTDGLHTVSVHVNNLTGRFKLQGTLSMEPTENDWFDIYLEGNPCQGQPFVQYPKDPANPTTFSSGGWIGDTGVDAFTFVGNFTFLRAKLEREYLGTVDIVNNSLGVVDKVLLSL
jgi:hypothetical protein